MIDNVPMAVQSRGRCYTDERQRRSLDTTDAPYGRGTPLQVGLVHVDRSPEWGTYGQSATFSTELGYYGEIPVPAEVRETLGIVEGDTVRVTARAVPVRDVSVSVNVGEAAE